MSHLESLLKTLILGFRPPEILIQDVWGAEGEFRLLLAKMDLETTAINSVCDIPKP